MKPTKEREIDDNPGRNSRIKRRFSKSEFRHHLFIESYGVKICITFNIAEELEDARKIIAENLSNYFREIEATNVEHQFTLVRNRTGKDSLYKNGEKLLTGTNRKTLFDYLGSKIRITVAEFAVGRVFVHAGVVGWKGKAIMIPGKSFSGKTTLVAALVKRGALYYSDEYAVLDEEGYVRPFPKPLSIRGEIDDYKQVEYSVEELGGKAATEKNRVGLVLITEYKPNTKWIPQILTHGRGIMEIIKNTVPVRHNPEFTLNVSNQIAANSLIIKSKRGDTSKSIELIIDFLKPEVKQLK